MTNCELPWASCFPQSLLLINFAWATPSSVLTGIRWSAHGCILACANASVDPLFLSWESAKINDIVRINEHRMMVSLVQKKKKKSERERKKEVINAFVPEDESSSICQPITERGRRDIYRGEMQHPFRVQILAALPIPSSIHLCICNYAKIPL